MGNPRSEIPSCDGKLVVLNKTNFQRRRMEKGRFTSKSQGACEGLISVGIIPPSENKGLPKESCSLLSLTLNFLLKLFYLFSEEPAYTLRLLGTLER